MDINKSENHFMINWLFLRFLGIIYLIAFISIGTQILGLIGENGIIPAYFFLQSLQEQIGGVSFWIFPTLCWFNSSDGFLLFLCYGGAVLSLLLFIGFYPALILILLWIFYLSLTTVCQVFLSFQWDILLLETGFLAIFFAPVNSLHRPSSNFIPSNLVLWLFRWLLFRLIFSSGIVKLLSGDEAWHNLTALNYHYLTQPLPNLFSYYFHGLPENLQKISTLTMFIIELVIPFLFFLKKPFRLFAAIITIFFQVLIMITGNYCFFNLLTIALCLLLLDDSVFLNLLSGKFKNSILPQLISKKIIYWHKWIITFMCSFIIVISSVLMLRMLGVNNEAFVPVMKIYRYLSSYHLVNNYGLFAVMTTTRPEIIIEGSKDGENWYEYEFKYKPGNISKPPQFVAPHQPRLDWQMWFAALGRCEDNKWFINFCLRLLQDSKEVKSLIKNNPFPKKPPKYIRTLVYDYDFADFKTQKEKGHWWKRELRGGYCPVFSLQRN